MVLVFTVGGNNFQCWHLRKTHAEGVWYKLIWVNTPKNVFTTEAVLLRWVPVARPGPTTLLAPMYLTKGRNYKVKLWTTWVTSAVFMPELWMAGHSRPAMNNPLEFPWASGIAHKMLINQHDSSEGSFPILEENTMQWLWLLAFSAKKEESAIGKSRIINASFSDNSLSVKCYPLQVTRSTQVLLVSWFN